MSDQSLNQAEPKPIPPDHQLTTGPRPRRKHRAVAWIGVLLVFGLVIWWVENHKQEAATTTGGGRRGAAGGIVTAVTTTAQLGDIGVYEEAIGTVTPVYTASIVSQATGQITAVHYREGQNVTKGTPLIEIDPRPYEATLTQAEGQLEHDTQLLAQAKMDEDRYRAAWARNSIAKQILDDQEKTVLQDEGTVKNDEGTVAYDKVQLGYCHIVAPITGRVGLRLVDPGNLVSADGGTVLAVITQMQPITVIFTISEDSLPQVISQMHAQRSLEVQALDRSQNKIITKGKLASLDNQIDTTTGTLKLRAMFTNQDQVLFPNQFVNTRLLVKTLSNVVLVASSAVQHNGTQAFVWAVENGQAQIVNVVTGVTDNNMTQVEGIAAGTVVANGSFEKLTPGAKVIPPAAPGEGARQSGASGKKTRGNPNSAPTKPGSPAP
jgi:multidrug efflux system membrane fusion protein